MPAHSAVRSCTHHGCTAACHPRLPQHREMLRHRVGRRECRGTGELLTQGWVLHDEDRWWMPPAQSVPRVRKEPRNAGGPQAAAFDRFTRIAQTHLGWLGRAGQTDRAVLMAVIRPVRGRVSTPAGSAPAGSGEQAGFRQNTVARSLRRLEAAGWIKRKLSRKASLGSSALWELQINNPHI